MYNVDVANAMLIAAEKYEKNGAHWLRFLYVVQRVTFRHAQQFFRVPERVQ